MTRITEQPADVEFIERARRVIPGGVNSTARRIAGIEDLAIATTDGATFTDTSGRTYVDFHCAYGPYILGHRDPDVDGAVREAMATVDLAGVGVTEGEVELAEKFRTHVPAADRVLFCASGSEATSYAIRLARAVTGRKYLMKFQGCFHGWHDHVAMNVISPADKIGQKDPLSTGILPEIIDSTLVLPFNDRGAVEAAFSEIGDEIAAVILEPIPHNIGTVLPHDGYLEFLRDITNRKGAVLIFDEVVTGFRHSLGGYQAICGVTPDLATYGKAMANGYPIAALAGRAELMDEWNTIPGKPVLFAGTYNGHPAMVAAALGTIRKMENEPVHEHVDRLGELARAELARLYAERQEEATVVGFGSVFLTYFTTTQIDRYEDLLLSDPDKFVGVRLLEMEHGIFELPLNLKRSSISYAHEEAHIERLVEATALALDEYAARN